MELKWDAMERDPYPAFWIHLRFEASEVELAPDYPLRIAVKRS